MLPDDATESQPTYRLARAVTQRRPIRGARRNDEYQDDADNISEDSDAKRITKKSTMAVDGHTFEI